MSNPLRAVDISRDFDQTRIKLRRQFRTLGDQGSPVAEADLILRGSPPVALDDEYEVVVQRVNDQPMALPGERAAVITRKQFTAFLDELYEADWETALTITVSELSGIEPFKTWIARWNHNEEEE